MEPTSDRAKPTTLPNNTTCGVSATFNCATNCVLHVKVAGQTLKLEIWIILNCESFNLTLCHKTASYVFTVLACESVRSRNSVLALPRWLQMTEEGQYKVSAAAGRRLSPPTLDTRVFTAFSCCLRDDKTVLTEKVSYNLFLSFFSSLMLSSGCMFIISRTILH